MIAALVPSGLGATIQHLVVAIQVGEGDCFALLKDVEPRVSETLPDGLVEVEKRVLDASGSQKGRPQGITGEGEIGTMPIRARIDP